MIYREKGKVAGDISTGASVHTRPRALFKMSIRHLS